MPYERVSEEAEDVLKQIIDHEHDSKYWEERFEGVSNKDDIILRGCFKELQDNGLIKAQWADNFPYLIAILKDGYMYEKHLEEESSPFEKKLQELLKRSENIKAPINVASIDVNIDDYNQPAEEWMNDVKIFKDKYLKTHPLEKRMESLLFHRPLGAYKELIACLKSISKDEDFINEMKGNETVSVPAYKAKSLPEYDVFISHANKDKLDIVEDLYKSLDRLGVNIFYDKEEIEWGDNWKDRIIQGTEKSEFAIIVISNNFFGREWTEIELKNFLNRQNRSGQKIILPILHNITIEQLGEKYPAVADIQAISSEKYSCDQIALLFAKQFIKRLKSL